MNMERLDITKSIMNDLRESAEKDTSGLLVNGSKYASAPTTLCYKSIVENARHAAMRPVLDMNSMRRAVSPFLAATQVEQAQTVADDIASRIDRVFQSSTTEYISLNTLVQKTGATKNVVKAFLREHEDKFRKSHIQWNGDEVYLLNTSLSWVRDAWMAFRYMNARKFR